MQTHIPPSQYFERNYPADFEVFGGDMMCGFSLTDALSPPKRARFAGLAEFVVCQFELNLLSQAIYTHSCAAYTAWRRFSAPFADTRLCFSGHGMGSHAPYSILRFAQQPMAAPNTAPVKINWEILQDYTKCFLTDYVTRFIATATPANFSSGAFLQAIERDADCTACVLTPTGWDSKHVLKLLNHGGAA
jgi:hypothetical protein